MIVDAKVTWNGRMSFDGTADTGYHLPLDSAPAVGGDNGGFRPMELLATGLAGCTAMDVISILTKKRQDVTDFEVRVHLERAAEHPKVFTTATIYYEVSGHAIDETAVRRAIELSAVRYCPAQAMFGQLMPIQLRYEIYELAEDGSRILAIRGEFLTLEEQV
jgi:putative redox protein